MELLLITENKLKIMLSRDDLCSYGITVDEIDYDNTETRRVFWSLLDEAKQKTGFDAAISRIFIQIFPDREGGCEMYVSRLRSIEGQKRGVTCKIDASCARRAFVFDSLERLLAVCRAVRGAPPLLSSSAYTERREGACRCFLITEGDGAALERITEYGELWDVSLLPYYIKEHCKVICEGNAIETLGAL